MNPEQNQPVPQPQNNTNPQPVYPSGVPVQPVYPQQQPMPGQPQQAQPVYPVASQPGIYPPAAVQPKKSKKLFWIIGSAVATLILLAVGALVLLSLPAIQTRAVAKTFMADLSAGDSAAALKYADPEFGTSFIEGAATSLKGSSSKIIDSAYNSKSESFYLFSLDNSAKYKYARIGVTKTSKRLVTSLVYDSQRLKLVPSASTSSPAATSTSTTPTATPAATPVATATTTGQCMGASDYSLLNSYPVDKGFDGKYTFYDNVFFNPDSTGYAYANIMDDWYAKYKSFYAQQQSKDFTIQLQGQVYSATPDPTLANQRAAKVKAELISKSSIPESRLTVIAPDNTLNSDTTAARNVDIIIKSSDSCK